MSTNGFTISQVSRFRNRALGGFDSSDFEKCAQASSDMVSALAGAGLGAGLGLLSDSIRPADPDEDRRRRRLTSLLAGATLGGIAGYGLNKARHRVPIIAPEKKPSMPSRIGEFFDPDISTLAALGGVGYGVAPTFSRGGFIRGLMTPGAADSAGLRLTKDFFKNNPDVTGALAQYLNATGGGKRVGLHKLLTSIGLGHISPWAGRVARSNNAGAFLRNVLSNNPDFQNIVARAGSSLTPAGANPSAEAFSHNAAKVLKKMTPKGRALRAAALLGGLAAGGYKLYDTTH